ncbi:MAG: PorT family protein [Cyclobacteriaceae bacterium]
MTLGLASYSSAQDSYLGFKLGYNQSQLKVTETGSVSLKDHRGINASFVLSTKNKNFGLSLEPGYILKRSRVDNDTLDYFFHNINLPFTFDLYLNEKIKLNAGPELTYLAKATNNLNDTTKQNLGDIYTRKWDLGGVVSASYSVSYFMDLGIRYSRSFTKISKQDLFIERRDIYNQYLQFYILLKIAN